MPRCCVRLRLDLNLHVNLGCWQYELPTGMHAILPDLLRWLAARVTLHNFDINYPQATNQPTKPTTVTTRSLLPHYVPRPLMFWRSFLLLKDQWGFEPTRGIV